MFGMAHSPGRGLFGMAHSWRMGVICSALPGLLGRRASTEVGNHEGNKRRREEQWRGRTRRRRMQRMKC